MADANHAMKEKAAFGIGTAIPKKVPMMKVMKTLKATKDKVVNKVKPPVKVRMSRKTNADSHAATRLRHIRSAARMGEDFSGSQDEDKGEVRKTEVQVGMVEVGRVVVSEPKQPKQKMKRGVRGGRPERGSAVKWKKFVATGEWD